MQRILREQIRRVLATNPYCIVPKDYLERIWPIGKKRAGQIKKFAEENNWRVRYYPGQQGVIITKRFKPVIAA